MFMLRCLLQELLEVLNIGSHKLQSEHVAVWQEVGESCLFSFNHSSV